MHGLIPNRHCYREKKMNGCCCKNRNTKQTGSLLATAWRQLRKIRHLVKHPRMRCREPGVASETTSWLRRRPKFINGKTLEHGCVHLISAPRWEYMVICQECKMWWYKDSTQTRFTQLEQFSQACSVASQAVSKHWCKRINDRQYDRMFYLTTKICIREYRSNLMAVLCGMPTIQPSSYSYTHVYIFW